MKHYAEYMDNISVPPALHHKIMRRQKPAPHRRRPLRYAGAAACAAVLALCLLTVPGILSRPAVPQRLVESTAGSTGVLPTGGPQGADQTASVSSGPSDPGTDASPLYPLTLNDADMQLGTSMMIPGHFWYTLTGEQQKAVFPDFSFPLSATVNYRGDGSIFNIAAYETDDAGNVKRYNGLHTMTEIRLAPGEITDDLVYDYEPRSCDVNGIPVVAGVFDDREGDGVALYTASFKLEGIAYRIALHDNDDGENGLDRLTEIVNAVIRDGAPDLSTLSDPVIPELRDEILTLQDARGDPDFGAYLPESIPALFKFETARRFLNQESDYLFAAWHTAGYDYIQWRVSRPAGQDREHIVSADEREKYDLSLYPIPRADSVPEELREYVDSPVFRAEELSLELVRARAYQADDRGDTPGWRMDFSVLYGEALVSVNIKGVSPEQVWEMLSALEK